MSTDEQDFDRARFDESLELACTQLTLQDVEVVHDVVIPRQRYAEDREHLVEERDAARQIGDLDGVETAEAHLEVLEVLAAERRLAQRGHIELEDEERER